MQSSPRIHAGQRRVFPVFLCLMASSGLTRRLTMAWFGVFGCCLGCGLFMGLGFVPRKFLVAVIVSRSAFLTSFSGA